MDYQKWATARYFWIQVGKLYENRGPGKPGNQLDCVRGTRAYFGFGYNNIDLVPRNTKLGEVIMRFENKPEKNRSIWYANNSMDKVHLPVPGWYGPVTYDDHVVRFERLQNLYKVTIGNQSDFNNWQKLSQKQGFLYEMTQGRLYGFYTE